MNFDFILRDDVLNLLLAVPFIIWAGWRYHTLNQLLRSGKTVTATVLRRMGLVMIYQYHTHAGKRIRRQMQLGLRHLRAYPEGMEFSVSYLEHRPRASHPQALLEAGIKRAKWEIALVVAFTLLIALAPVPPELAALR